MSEREQRVLDTLEQNRRRPPKFTAPRIDMSHGAGGKATHKLIEGLLLPALDNPALAPLADAATLPFADSRIALTTDSYVVRPLAFPGGSIGELAVNGTVNDLAVSGAMAHVYARGRELRWPATVLFQGVEDALFSLAHGLVPTFSNDLRPKL